VPVHKNQGFIIAKERCDKNEVLLSSPAGVPAPQKPGPQNLAFPIGAKNE
jgi:hypothetical protein